MKFIYPAVIRKNNEGKYDAFFPDLECCCAQGDTLEEAVDNANEAAYNWLYVEVMDSPNSSSKFFIRSGFVKWGTVIKFFWKIKANTVQ